MYSDIQTKRYKTLPMFEPSLDIYYRYTLMTMRLKAEEKKTIVGMECYYFRVSYLSSCSSDPEPDRKNLFR